MRIASAPATQTYITRYCYYISDIYTFVTFPVLVCLVHNSNYITISRISIIYDADLSHNMFVIFYNRLGVPKRNV